MTIGNAAQAIPTLAISPEKVCFVVVKAREFDVKEGFPTRMRVQRFR